MVKTIWAPDFFLFQSWQPICKTGWWLKNITEILLFMRQIFRIFKIFRGAAPNPAWGAYSAPQDPQLLYGALRALLRKAQHAPYFPKNLSQTTLGPWPATPLSLLVTFLINCWKTAKVFRVHFSQLPPLLNFLFLNHLRMYVYSAAHFTASCRPWLKWPCSCENATWYCCQKRMAFVLSLASLGGLVWGKYFIETGFMNDFIFWSAEAAQWSK